MSDPHDAGAAAGLPTRPWPRAWLLALVLVASGVLASATANPLLGRYVHWDRIGTGAPLALLALAVALRRRWL